VAPDDRAGLRRPPPQEQLPLRKPAGLVGHRPGPQADLHHTEFAGQWEAKYPAIIKLWENAWAEFVPFLSFDAEIRTVIYTTNAIESINARIRKAVKARGHFPTETAALKCIYMALMSLDPTGRGRQRWTNRWKPALNAFTVAFPGRIIVSTK
jgi:putative transposase